jgi:uncharacterized protein
LICNHGGIKLSLKAKINEDLKNAMKAKDKERTGVLRMLLSEIKYTQAAVNIHQELPEDEVVKVVSIYHKRLTKAMDDYPEGDRRAAIRSELVIVEDYLPKKASESEVASAIEKVMSETEDRTFGTLMKAVMTQLGSGGDGKVVSSLLKAKLGN